MPSRRPFRDRSRRSFVRAAVAVGGATALAACLERSETDLSDVPRASDEPADRPERQHAWNDALASDEDGNVVPAEHHVFLGLAYAGDGTPTDGERETVESALTTLERAFERGPGGLLFTVGYAPAYFDRFDELLPDSVDLPAPEAIGRREDPEFDEFDALAHLASDHGAVLLAVEEALEGERDDLNGVPVGGSFEDVLDVANRRTGFVGDGLPAEKAADEDLSSLPSADMIPEDAPFFMGFTSGFAESQATEERATIPDGPFADGTTTHLESIRLDLGQWFGQDTRELRIDKLFSPTHTDEELVEGVGNNLGDDSGVVEHARDAETAADERGRVGHAQKAARAREDGEPLLLRRDVNSTDDGEAGTHFLAHQRRIEEFVRVREAMNGADLDVDRSNNGILQYLRVRRRGNFLVPPRSHRSLPTPNP